MGVMVRGLAALRDRLNAAGLPFREQRSATNPVIQVFVRDPAGVMVEMSFDRALEEG